MSQKQIYPCTAEEVSPLANIMAASMLTDIVWFGGHSTKFTPAFAASMVEDAAACNALITSDTLTQRIRILTRTIGTKCDELSIKVNHANNYIHMVEPTDLNVDVNSMGVTPLRATLNNGNTEGVVKDARVLINNVQANITVLEPVGLTPAFLTEFIELVDEIETLGNEQTDKKSKRNRNTEAYIGQFNELWTKVKLVLATGKALFQGVDDVKLRDYTYSVVIKRIRAAGRNPITPVPEA